MHELIRGRLGEAIRRACDKDGCSIKFGRVDKDAVTVVDCDRLPQEYRGNANEKMADCLVFAGGPIPAVIVVELKSGRLDAINACRQLTAGARAAERVGAQAGVETWLPAVVCGGKKHATEIKILRRTKILAFGAALLPALYRCGIGLNQILKDLQNG